MGDTSIAFDVVATEPASVTRGASLDALEAAWLESRRDWSRIGRAPEADLPIGVGWLSYDLARQWVRLDQLPPGDGAWPLIEFRFFDALWICETDQAEARIVACDDAAADRLARRLERQAPLQAAPLLGVLSDQGTRDQQRAVHAAAVDRIKQYLFAGDAYQVNLARRLTAPISDGDPLWMAAMLRARAPAPHALWMGGRSGAASGGVAPARRPIDQYLVGNSPERFLRVGTDGSVETRPIKGTRPRGGDAAADAAARLDLRESPKDRAEHVMIVDLERNDLGRVCQTGSVVVEDLLRVVELPTVFHLVSTVRGRLRAEVGLRELLQATFPGGSITGAPKIRAMEIIAERRRSFLDRERRTRRELEDFRRGIYTGATGWLGAAGDLDLAVAIRSATVAGGVATLFVGGGIVADSDPAAEWEETEVKAQAFSRLCSSADAWPFHSSWRED